MANREHMLCEKFVLFIEHEWFYIIDSPQSEPVLYYIIGTDSWTCMTLAESDLTIFTNNYYIYTQWIQHITFWISFYIEYLPLFILTLLTNFVNSIMTKIKY